MSTTPHRPRPRIFLTGGSGFLGTAVLRELLARGHDVRCLVRSEMAATRLLEAVSALDTLGRLDVVFGALRAEGVDRGWLAGCDCLIHAAGALNGAPSTLVRHNVAATRALVDAAVGSTISRLVLVSSLGVYATHALQPGAVLDEACPIDPAPERRGAYAYSKVAQERVCRAACRDAGLPLVTLRPGVIFGPGRTCLTDRVGPRLGRLVGVVHPDRQLPYIFVANCASAVALAASIEVSAEETFNLVDDELPTAGQLVAACRATGWDVRAIPIPAWATMPLARAYGWCYRRTDAMLPPSFLPYVADAIYKPLRFSNRRAKVHLQWRPSFDLRSALRQTLGGEQAAAVGR